MPQADTFSVWASEADGQTVQDILDAIQANTEQACHELQVPCQFLILIEMFPDQASFDEHLMNPEMCVFFAIAGNENTIQMVSPANQSPHNLSYQDGVLVAVHSSA